MTSSDDDIQGNGVIGDRAAAADVQARDALTPTVTPAWDAVTLRLEALRIAHDASAEPDVVKARADTYYTWLKG